MRPFFIAGLFLLGTRFSFATPLCTEVYTAVRPTRGNEIAFTQSSIGKRWAEFKKQEYEGEWKAAKKANSKMSLQQFIQEKIAKKPMRAVIDIDGNVRLIDNHHKFYALTLLYGKEIDFPIAVIIVKDYSLDLVSATGIHLWTPEKMLLDMIEMEFINVTPNVQHLSLRWFNTLPRSILEMGDSPIRSLMSLVMKSFPIDLSGSSFQPHVQNHLGQRMIEMGIEIFNKDSFGQANINRLRDEITDRPELVDFLLERADQNGEKYPQIVEMLMTFDAPHIPRR